MNTEHNVTYLPSASRGGDNAYYLNGCDTAGHCPAYAACLHKINMVESRRDAEVINQDCTTEIRKGRCKALHMRQEEDLKGVALYYIPRASVKQWDELALTREKREPKKRSVISTKMHAKSILDSIDQTSFADVINQATA
ncbi:hypothetical protein LJC19_04730 [Oxalobacter sp. OttesenSCG-928-P03]|nr:hypothetical protein [Oxalobacter sp. OttesenSCG-928-P03]